MKIEHKIWVGLMSSLAILGTTRASSAEETAEVPLTHAIANAVGGAPAKGDYVLSLQGGWPFTTARAQIGLNKRLALLAEVESVFFLRNRPMLGVGMRWVDKPNFRITGDALFGWLFQNAEEIRRGPNAELRIRMAIPLKRFVPYMMLGTRHAFLPDLTTVERASGTDSFWTVRHEWTPWATLGLGFALTRKWGIDLGIDAGWVDAPTTIAIPGIHAGIHYGGGR